MTNSKFPGMRWSPEGEARTFNAEHEVPEGWSDKHPNDPAFVKPKQPEPDSADMARVDIVAALNAGGLTFQKNAKTETLYAQLTGAVKERLTARNIEFDAAAPTSALLKLFPAE